MAEPPTSASSNSSKVSGLIVPISAGTAPPISPLPPSPSSQKSDGSVVRKKRFSFLSMFGSSKRESLSRNATFNGDDSIREFANEASTINEEPPVSSQIDSSPTNTATIADMMSEIQLPPQQELSSSPKEVDPNATIKKIDLSISSDLQSDINTETVKHVPNKTRLAVTSADMFASDTGNTIKRISEDAGKGSFWNFFAPPQVIKSGYS